MRCRTAAKSYQTVAGLKRIFQDGTTRSTANAQSKADFLESHSALISAVTALARSVKENKPLAERIHHKLKIKNTTGYSLNALADFTDPFDIIEHLMIGSEGTLGFIAEITYKTVVEHPFKASALIIFPDVENSCRDIPILKNNPFSTAELIYRAGLRSV